MDNLKRRVVSLLQDDARLSAESIAAMLGEDAASVKKAIAEMESDGTIIKYAALVNTDSYQEDEVEALIEVKVVPKQLYGYDAIAEEIYKFAEVKSVYLMSGSYDLLVIVNGRNLKSVAMFVAENLSTLDAVQSTATRFILKKYKVEGITLFREEEPNRLAIQP